MVTDVFTPTQADPIIRVPSLLTLPAGVLLAFAHSQPSAPVFHRSRSSYYNGLTSPDTQPPYVDTLQ